ncbi:MAG TPA: hypothetical protein VHV53_05770 [Solirubrobacterales bacterium]|jgi:hypothetical protein|nr:hypothetical protein [Solirubrobacterales bacterium]
MFVQTQEIDAIGLRDAVAEPNRIEPRRVVPLRVVHDVDREREAEAIILRLVLTERPSELRTAAVMARIGEPESATRAIDSLVEAGLLCRIDEYVLATAAAVRFDCLRSHM